MNAIYLLLTAALTAHPPGDARFGADRPLRGDRNQSVAADLTQSPFFQALGRDSDDSIATDLQRAVSPAVKKGQRNATAPIIRGQSPGYGAATLMPIIVDPQDPGNSAATGNLVPQTVGPGQPLPYTTYQAPGVSPDPFLAQPFQQQPFAPAPQSGAFGFGLNGPQAYRYGWSARYDLAYMPSSGTTKPNVGNLGILALDLEKEYVSPMCGGFTFSMAPQFGYRSWDGPFGKPGASHLPGAGYNFGLGLKVASPMVNDVSFELGFNPHMGTDFSSRPNREAVMLDASGIMFWRWSPQFMVAVGAQYWERINNLVIPYGGFVYTPNEYLEFRIILPKPRVSVFLGTPWGIPTWAYAQGEYHVEAFQLGLSPAAGQTLTQFSDYRVLGGLRFDAGWLSTYAEAGYIFNRDVKFHRIQQNFSINNGFIARIGLRY